MYISVQNKSKISNQILNSGHGSRYKKNIELRTGDNSLSLIQRRAAFLRFKKKEIEMISSKNSEVKMC